ncbi:MAG: hypothetical protein AAF368_16775, partial [Planctomycetota bacterium]
DRSSTSALKMDILNFFRIYLLAQAAAGADAVGQVEVDLKGEPARVKVEIVTVPFKGLPGVDATLERTSDEARALAQAWVDHFADSTKAARPEAGDVGSPLLLLNHGLRDGVAERMRFDLFKEFQTRSTELQQRRRSGELSPKEEREAAVALEEEFRERVEAMQATIPTPRAAFEGRDAPAAKQCFQLPVGGAAILDHDPKNGGIGFRVVHRLE